MSSFEFPFIQSSRSGCKILYQNWPLLVLGANCTAECILQFVDPFDLNITSKVAGEETVVQDFKGDLRVESVGGND